MTIPDNWEETRFGLRRRTLLFPGRRGLEWPRSLLDERASSKKEAKKKPKKVTPEKKREYNRRYYKKHVHGKPRTKEVESDIILGKVNA